MHSRYFVTMLLHSSCGSSLLENSMHSSLEAFSSLHTQQGLTLVAPSAPGGLVDDARFSFLCGWFTAACQPWDIEVLDGYVSGVPGARIGVEGVGSEEKPKLDMRPILCSVIL